MSPGRVPPHDLQAEESILGAMLLSRDAIDVALKQLRAEDFYKTQHGIIFGAMEVLYAEGHPVDPVTVSAGLRDQGLLDRIGGASALVSLQAGTPSTSNAHRYATIVQEHSTLRNLIRVSAEIAEDAYSLMDAEDAYERALSALAAVSLPSGAVAAGPTIDEFLAVEDVYDWVVPGLLERGDRLVITGGEGKGKSTLLRQFAMQAASGISPFTDKNSNDPVRVMIVDCENSPAQSRRALRVMRLKAGDRLDSENLSILMRPAGLDLLRRPDRKWLSERIEANRPDLLMMGPIYRLHNDDPNEEKPARAIAAFIDDLRVRHGFALVLETHQPHASTQKGASRVLRPYGASLWTRWPEFGLGLLEDEKTRLWKLVPWRGSRDDRSWPYALSRGGPWMWNEVVPVDEDEPPFEYAEEEAI